MVVEKLFSSDSRAFDEFLTLEISILLVYRTSLHYLTMFAKLDENMFQRIFQNYLSGLISCLLTTDLSVVAANSVPLSCSVFAAGDSGQGVEKELRGRTDIMICRHEKNGEDLLEIFPDDSKYPFPHNAEIIFEVKVLEGELHRSDAWKPKDQLLGQLECCGKRLLSLFVLLLFYFLYHSNFLIICNDVYSQNEKLPFQRWSDGYDCYGNLFHAAITERR